MSYKRRRVQAKSSLDNVSTPSSRTLQASSQSGSARRNLPASSSPAFQSVSRSQRLSLQPPSRLSAAPSFARSTRSSAGDEDVVRADVEETESEILEREEADSMNEVIMAIDMRGSGVIGCAYYVAREETLFLMQDIKFGDMELVDTLKLHIEPSTVVISTRADEKLEQYLSKDARGIERGEEGSRSFVLLNSTPATDFG